MSSKSVARVLDVVEMVRELEGRGRSGVSTRQVGSQMTRRYGVQDQEYRKVVKRAVTEGFLLKKDNKLYFIASKNVTLPALAVLRKRKVPATGKHNSKKPRYAVLAYKKGVRSGRIRIGRGVLGAFRGSRRRRHPGRRSRNTRRQLNYRRQDNEGQLRPARLLEPPENSEQSYIM